MHHRKCAEFASIEREASVLGPGALALGRATLDAVSDGPASLRSAKELRAVSARHVGSPSWPAVNMVREGT